MDAAFVCFNIDLDVGINHHAEAFEAFTFEDKEDEDDDIDSVDDNVRTRLGGREDV